MLRRHFVHATVLGAGALPLAGFAPSALAAEPTKVSGPHVHENLAVYLIQGESAPGPVPLTLQEAMEKGLVRVHETGNVNSLAIENIGWQDVFIQSGDIVKGGQQDRVLTVSLILPSRSGRLPIAAYCVEQGRWAPRGKEDATKFSSAATAMPSRDAKLAMKADPDALSGRGRDRQSDVWRSVAEAQEKLSRNVGASVAAKESRSSLQLSLENEKLKEATARYVSALRSVGERSSDALGFAFAVNGTINSADVYPSNGLFAKMWPKLLEAAAVEAIGEARKGASAAPPPAADTVRAFLAASEAGKGSTKPIDAANALESRSSDKALYYETQRRGGAWVHKNYLAR